MKISFRAFTEAEELHLDPGQYQSEVTDISGKKVCIRLLKGMLSDKLKTGMFLSLELPNGPTSVAIREIELEPGWVILHCKSKSAFPAIVIGRQSLSPVIK